MSIAPPRYAEWFQERTGFSPHPWQETLGEDETCRDRLLRVPTGFGKTAGVVLPWLYHRVLRGDRRWPTRLVFCLPMRVLVEQTEQAILEWLRSTGDKAKLHVLMGGIEAERWELHPEKPAVLLGTQDMLLSRALNRGYGSGRARWPMSFGLVHQDGLWVLDEVQLMDVGLATSTQLAAFRRADTLQAKGLRPCVSWWMSATLQPRWLETVDHRDHLDEVRIAPEIRRGGLWEVKKKVERCADVRAEADVAKLVHGRHKAGKLTLVVLNQVNRAVEVFRALEASYSEKKGKPRVLHEDGPEIRLVHSRFRGRERGSFREAFLRRGAPVPSGGRIVVATQVVEAGVDISADLLVTDLAPWSSLVQRFGRCARYEGDDGAIVTLGTPKSAAPYEDADLIAAEEALTTLAMQYGDASPRSLEAFEEGTGADVLQRLYRYEPPHVLRRRDLDDLFDTTPDLSGTDLDISRYIRSGEERDVHVFWRALAPGFSRTVTREDIGLVVRDELCPVPVGELREWMRASRNRPVYVRDYLDPAGRWRLLDAARVVPGMTLLLSSDAGGYHTQRGWSPKETSRVDPVVQAPADPDDADAKLDRSTQAADDDSLSQTPWKTIAVHGRETGALLGRIAANINLDPALSKLLALAGRWHDAGKAHFIFQEAILDEARRQGGAPALRADLAKAPPDAWRRPAYPDRPGFRHELASTLALLELLRRAAPDHAALTGGCREMLEALGTPPEAPTLELRVDTHDPLAQELIALSAGEIDLLLWLVCSHHGKVRCAWTSTPADQSTGQRDIHGVREGDPMAAFPLTHADGSEHPLPALTLSLEAAGLGVGRRYGASWGDRVAGLLAAYGPFTLAYLEALVRAADARASMGVP